MAWNGRIFTKLSHDKPARPRSNGDCPVHPRVCGEHILGADNWRGARGSSPRLRGTRQRRLPRRRKWRFIPASAGNTPSGTRTTRPTASTAAAGLLR